MNKLARLPLHPLLIGVYPTMALYAHNILEVEPGDAMRAFALVTLGSLLMVVGSRLVLPGWPQAALLATLSAILIFSYGHVYSLLEGFTLLGVMMGRHRYLAVLWLTLLAAGWWGARVARDTQVLTKSLNLIGLALWAVPIYQLAAHQVRLFQPLEIIKTTFSTSAVDSESLPDIYYIIPDAYTRDDTLLDLYRYDNTPFLDELSARGFYVAQCSRSNYARTYLSLSSSLNMDYIQAFYTRRDSAGLTRLIRQNEVRDVLEANGYQTVAIETGFFRTEWEDADLYYQRPEQGRYSGGVLRGSNEFEAMLFNTTAGVLLLEANTALNGNLGAVVNVSPKFDRYAGIQFVLDTLEQTTQVPGPKFVFAHVRAPHEPYIFSADGDFLQDQEDFIPGYRDQVRYINQRLLDIIDRILEASRIPPIIVIQGDHGGDETKQDARRLHILNAYLLPPSAAERLYPSITPVNTFRLIFDSILGTEYGLLDDISYYSPPQASFDFTVSPIIRPGCDQE
jgi:hypothetical protein